MEILNRILAMHMRGFDHNDFKEKHVVHGSQGYRIIGHERMSRHRCGWERKVAWKNCSENFPCHTMKEIGDKLHAWEEGTCI